MDSCEFERRRRKKTSYFSSPEGKSKTNSARTSTPIKAASTGTDCADLEILWEAIEAKDIGMFNRIVSNSYVNSNQVFQGGSLTLLHFAVGWSNNDPTIVEKLLRMGGDPNNMEVQDKLSPLHISALYDFHQVMGVLIKYGGNLKLPNGDGKTCFDIVIKNVECELREECFKYLYPRSQDFRRSMGMCRDISRVSLFSNIKKETTSHSNGANDEGYSTNNESQLDSVTKNERMHSIAKRLCPTDYSNLLTQDELEDAGTDNDKDKLNTVLEKSGLEKTRVPEHFLTYHPINNVVSDSNCPGFAKSARQLTPTKLELEKLQETIKQLSNQSPKLSHTPTCTNSSAVLTQKPETNNLSSELQAGIKNLNVIKEWGNLNIHFLQNFKSRANSSKSFWNFLLLDTRKIIKTNFSGDHMNEGVITNSNKFLTFLNSVFYIGVSYGNQNISLQQLVKAKQKHVQLGKYKPIKNVDKLTSKILEIWRAGLGVIIVKIFHPSYEEEANIHEACMIDAIGLVGASDIKRGGYTGTMVEKWPQKTKSRLGSVFLYKSFKKFVVSDQKQFHPSDIF